MNSDATEVADLVVEDASPRVADGMAELVGLNVVDIRDALHRLTYENDCYQQTVMHLGYDAQLTDV